MCIPLHRGARAWPHVACAHALSTRAVAQWYLALHEQTDAFLTLLALLPACAALACIPFLKHLPKRRGGGSASAANGAEGLATRRTFFAASGLTLGIATYMAVTVMLQSEKPATFLPLVPLAFTTMLLLLGLYAVLPAANRGLEEMAASAALSPSTAAASAPLLAESRGGGCTYGSTATLGDMHAGTGIGTGSGRTSPSGSPHSDESHYVGDAANGTLLMTLQRLDYWTFYSLYVVNLGVGLTLSNNLESIAVSKGATTVAGYVALSSVATCMGTLLGAHASEATLDAHIGLARPWCCLPSYTLMALGCIAIATGGRGVLYGAVFATMFGYGANLSILPAALHERYGQRHFGSIWAFLQTAMVVASFLFATGLAAHNYELHATLNAAGVQTCVVRPGCARARQFCAPARAHAAVRAQGQACFRSTFLSLAALAACGAGLAAVLATLLADFYREVIAGRSAAEPGGYLAALGLRSPKADAAESL